MFSRLILDLSVRSGEVTTIMFVQPFGIKYLVLALQIFVPVIMESSSRRTCFSFTPNSTARFAIAAASVIRGRVFLLCDHLPQNIATGASSFFNNSAVLTARASPRGLRVPLSLTPAPRTTIASYFIGQFYSRTGECLAKQHAAVDHDLFAGHIARHVAGQKQGDFANFVGLAHAVHRDFGHKGLGLLFEHLGVGLWRSRLHRRNSWCVNATRGDGVNPNIVRGQFERRIFRKSPDAVLGSVVVSQTDHRRVNGINRSNIDDFAATTLLPHHFTDIFRGKKNAAQIDMHYLFKIFAAHFSNWFGWVNAGVIDQNINATKRLLADLNHFLDIYFAANVGFD